MKKAVRGLRARIANCSVKAAFALYAAIAIITAIALTIAFSVVASLVAESTIEDDPYAYSGTFVFDEASNSLVPAETLSWYEVPAFESFYGQDGTEALEGESAGTGAVILYVEGSSRADSKPISLGNPPATVPDGAILDVSWTASASDVHDDSLSLSEIAAYDAAERPARPGFDAALALAEQLPDNADGEKPIVSNVAYYVPYPGDSPAYRAVAWGYIASVPVVFVACLVVAGRLFYRNRIARPVAAMEEAAAKISDGDLDFNMEPQRNDELGRLCARFEDMRAELARSKSEMWRAAENRRRVNAAFAHDLRTPLTVVRGRAELIEMTTDGKVKEAAAVIRRQAGRLAAFADSMSGIDSLEDAPLRKEALRASSLLAKIEEAAGGFADSSGKTVSVSAGALPADMKADEPAILRVADNLISNAVRHAASAVSVEVNCADGSLTLSVSDDGPGFGQAAPRALEPFWRGAEERTGSAGGSDGHMGLGLYICSVLCAKHGGSMSVSDAPEGGGIVVASFDVSSCRSASAESPVC